MINPHQDMSRQSTPHYGSVSADPHGRDRIIEVANNESPYPPLPSVTTVISQELAGINRYPSVSTLDLRTAIAVRCGVDADQICVGAGSVDVLANLVSVLVDPGAEVVLPWRSFEAFPSVVERARATAVPVPLTAQLTHDLPAMAAAVTERTHMVMLCSPNNPTGTVLHTDEVVDFLARIPRDVHVVLDEAYTHFNQDTDAVRGLDLLAEHPNVICLHTFSKAYGLAGLRIGFSVSSREVAHTVRQFSLPFTVTNLAGRAAMASMLAEDELAARVDLTTRERGRVARELDHQGWRVATSQANFIWLDTGGDTARVAEQLHDSAIMTRWWEGEGIRMSLGTPRDNDTMISALAEIHDRL